MKTSDEEAERLVLKSFAALSDPMNQIQKAVSAMIEQLRVALGPVERAVADFARAAHDAWWDAYTEAGRPYGASDDGMYLWLEELSKIAALRREADERESQLEFLANWRRKIKAASPRAKS